MLNKPLRFPTCELYGISEVLSIRKLFVLSAVLRVHQRLTYDPNLNIDKRRNDEVCKLSRCRLKLIRRQFDFASGRIYNKVHKILKIFPQTYRECKKSVSKWILLLTYDETEKLIA